MALFDRDYMRSNAPEKKSFLDDGNNMLYLLIAVNAILYLLNIKLPLVSSNINLLAMIGSIFSHFNFGHLFFNMFSLYIFGEIPCFFVNALLNA